MPTLVEQSPDFVPPLPSTTVSDDYNYNVEDGDFRYRKERTHKGLVKWKLAKTVPDIGGTGWRTKQGHTLKNHTYYRTPANSNKWNDPVHAGYESWKAFHGPRLETNARLIEQMDAMDDIVDNWEKRKASVNRARAEQLDRFWRQKRARMRKERATSWTPHIRAKREFHDIFDTFDGDVNSLPYWALKKVLTPEVLAGDQRAIDVITSKMMREDAFKRMLKAWQNNRRIEILSDFADRAEYNQRLQQMAGQPTAEREPRKHTRPILTSRVNELS
ncbi:unnamed protein product, partial [Amoebophrya sp. A25]|eukprot:GSA25T00022615001.1